MSILNMSLTIKFRHFLMFVVAPIALWSGSLLGGYLRMEGQSAGMNLELCNRADQIETLENEVKELQEVIDFLDQMAELDEAALERFYTRERAAEGKAAHARLYTHESVTSDGKVGRITYSPK